MGIGTRLRMGMAKLLAGQAAYEPHLKATGSLNVQAVKYAVQPSYNKGYSQPVFGPEVSTVGAYSREGYTSRTFDKPLVSFKQQAFALETDEDVQLAVNHLSSQITGGEHYWKSTYDALAEHMTNFSTRIDFDWFDTILVKELLWYGNSFWKPRIGIGRIQSKDDLMNIPISSAVRVWWDRQRQPYKIEFRGSEYQGYHNPEDVMHFIWNPVDASAYGTGFGTAMTSTRDFIEVTSTGTQEKTLPSLLDRKYSTQMTMHITERRYVPHNVYVAATSGQAERDALANQLSNLNAGEDFVVGKQVAVQELGSATRAFDATQFSDLTQGGILKAMNDMRGKQASESSHSYANAKTSAVLDEIGLASFPLAVVRQLQDKFFTPWYEANPITDPNYGGGMIDVPWDEGKLELNFGRVEKRDIPIEHQIRLIELFMQSGLGQDPEVLAKLFEDAGLGLPTDFESMMAQQYNPQNAMPADMMQTDPYQDPYSFDNNIMGDPPMSDPYYDQAAQDVRGPEPWKSMDATWNDSNNSSWAQPSDPRLNFAIEDAIPNIIKRRKYRNLTNAEKLAIINVVGYDAGQSQ